MDPTANPQEPPEHFARLAEDSSLWLDGLEVLTRHECLELLKANSLGRVGLQVDNMPVILPVNYVMLSNGVAFRTAAGTKLSAALTHMTVAFEVDHADPSSRSGWSVLVVGRATEIVDPQSLGEAETLRVSPLAPGHRPHLIVIPVEHVSGRRF